MHEQVLLIGKVPATVHYFTKEITSILFVSWYGRLLIYYIVILHDGEH